MNSKNFKMFNMRQATIEDVRLYFAWVNEPEVRKSSIEKTAILFRDHMNWFTTKLNATDSFLFVLENDTIPIGQIRFDGKENNVYWMDYSIDKEYRGKGLGNILIKRGIQELNKYIVDPIIKAFVKKDNLPSRKVFERLNFENIKSRIIKNQEYFEYSLE